MRVRRLPLERKTDVQPDVDLTLLDPVISKYKGKSGNMIPLLQHTQNIYGYLPRTAFIKISKETGLNLSDMYGVATFYGQFRLSPVGKNVIKVCHGTACHVRGADMVDTAIEEYLGIKMGGTTPDRQYTIESVACLGCCSLAPVFMVDETAFGHLDRAAVRKAMNKHKQDCVKANLEQKS